MEIFNKYPVFQKLKIDSKTPVTITDFKIFPDCRKVYCKDKQVFLTGKEFDVLYTLAINQSCVLTKDQILQIAGSEEPQDEDNAVRCLIAGGSAEYLSVSGPSQPLIPLRTVCREVHKVGFLSPYGIGEKLVHSGYVVSDTDL